MAECSICHKAVEKPAEQLDGKALCDGCYRKGWRLETILIRKTVAVMPLLEEAQKS